jgi:hypothetical protein
MRPTRSFPLPLALLVASSAVTACTGRGPDAPSTAASPDILPLRTLRLYETGVGYFERSGALRGEAGGGSATAATSLPVPPGQLDDAIASLVILRGGSTGAVSGLSFASSVTRATARSRAGLPPGPDTPIAFQDLLVSMKGERVVVVSREGAAVREPVTGRVVEVAMEVDDDAARDIRRSKGKADEDPKHLVVTLLTDAGALTRVSTESLVDVRPVDPAFAARLDAALDATGTRGTRNARALRLMGDAHGQVTFGYVAETPIWRASYRLIEGPRTAAGAGEATLQGWALLHNDTDEDWRGVHLELVNGEPDSFVFPMAAPRYARRPLVHPEAPLSTLPQLQDTTADTLWGDHLDEAFGIGGLGGSGQGYGSGHGRLGGSHTTRAPSMRKGSVDADGVARGSSLLEVGDLASLVPASGVEQGAQFVYGIPGAFALDAHASALVPFVQRAVSGESVTLFAAPGEAGRTAIHFVNTTGQTLPTGTISVFGSGGFTGETSLDRLKPGERRFLQVGNDLDGQVTRTKAVVREESRRLAFDDAHLNEHFLRTTEETWALENRSASGRAFYVLVAADRNAKVTGADRVDFDEATGKPIVVFAVKGKEKSSRAFTVVEGLSRGIALDHLTEKTLRALLQKSTLPSSELAVLQQALPRAQSLEAAHLAVSSAERAAEVAQQALERLREDLKALGGGGASPGGAAAASPLVKRVVDAEDRVEASRHAKEVAEKTLEERREALRDALRKLEPTKPG